MPRRKLSPTQRERTTAAWEKHHTVSGVARELGVTWDTARLWLHASGARANHTGRRRKLALRRLRRQREVWHDARWMAAAYASLGTVGAVADRAGCSKVTASAWLRRHGIEVHQLVHRGADHYAAKLTEEDVREMRSQYKMDRTLACRERLAAEHGVSVAAVSKAVFRQSWKHVG